MSVEELKNCQLLLDKCHQDLRLFEAQLNSTISVFVDKFWSYFPYEIRFSKHLSHKPFLDAVEFLTTSIEQIESQLVDLEYQLLKKKIYAALKSQLLSGKPFYLIDYLGATYARALRVYSRLEKAKERENSMVVDHESENVPDKDEQVKGDKQNICKACDSPNYYCECVSFYERFGKINKYLREFKLLDGLGI